jgi:hypothetical protein
MKTLSQFRQYRHPPPSPPCPVSPRIPDLDSRFCDEYTTLFYEAILRVTSVSVPTPQRMYSPSGSPQRDAEFTFFDLPKCASKHTPVSQDSNTTRTSASPHISKRRLQSKKYEVTSTSLPRRDAQIAFFPCDRQPLHPRRALRHTPTNNRSIHAFRQRLAVSFATRKEKPNPWWNLFPKCVRQSITWLVGQLGPKDAVEEPMTTGALASRAQRHPMDQIAEVEESFSRSELAGEVVEGRLVELGLC